MQSCKPWQFTIMGESDVLPNGGASHLNHHLAPTTFPHLPIEIVARILLLALPHYNYASHVAAKHYYVTLHHLGRVSKAWRDIVLHWPGFCLHIDSLAPRRIWSAALGRSSFSLITVSMMADNPQFQMEVSQHIRQWEKAALVCTAETTWNPTTLETGAPNLRVCTIGVENTIAEVEGLDLQGGMSSRLEDLTLIGAGLRSWDSTLLGRLQRLSLRSVRILPHELVLALRECQALERLSLDMLRFPYSDVPALPDDPQPIVLASLSDLCIKDLGSGMISALLRVLKAPKCTAFIIGETSLWAMARDRHVPTCIEYITPAVKQALASPAHIEFIFDGSWTKLRVHDDDCTWQFMLLGYAAPKWINWVLLTFKDILSRTLCDVTFNHLGGDTVNLIREPEFLNSLSRIEIIRIGPGLHKTLLDTLMVALSQRQRGEWEGRWLCPHLRHLYIKGNYTGVRALLAMVRNRKKAVGMVNALETLELSHESSLSSKTLTKIEWIVGLHVLRRSKAKEQDARRGYGSQVRYWTRIFEETWSMYGMHEISAE
ncbi:hypothetical protein FRB93_008052 [Tulasnella sp. JGI-2019a]|nr:hypothetical protein FRB93_008052 [Tulasnella sp. JGI-2019a]